MADYWTLYFTLENPLNVNIQSVDREICAVFWESYYEEEKPTFKTNLILRPRSYFIRGQKRKEFMSYFNNKDYENEKRYDMVWINLKKKKKLWNYSVRRKKSNEL